MHIMNNRLKLISISLYESLIDCESQLHSNVYYVIYIKDLQKIQTKLVACIVPKS
jgi:hypothetical protein